MRRAKGIGPRDIARECRLDEDKIENWLGGEGSEELVECCRGMIGLSEDERLEKLEAAALDLLEIAVEECDVRVALFLADQFARGKRPHRVLAQAVNRRVTQSHIPLDQPLFKLKPAPADPVAAKQAAAVAYNLRPWAGAISQARRQLSDELVRAFPSRVESLDEPSRPVEAPAAENSAPASPVQDKKPSTSLAILPDTRQAPSVITDLLASSATSSIALLLDHPTNRSRDGP
ncbi:MAG: hypothetical protein AAFY56_05970 [Pseudomonadota bacterium]